MKDSVVLTIKDSDYIKDMYSYARNALIYSPNAYSREWLTVYSEQIRLLEDLFGEDYFKGV